MSLKTFHLVFILIAIIGADAFGVWSIFEFVRRGDPWILGLGLASLAGGLGLIVYSVKLLRGFDRAHIH